MLHHEAVGERAARERAISTREQLLAVTRSCMRVDLGWLELCARVREHARSLVHAKSADLFLCDPGGRELFSTMATGGAGRADGGDDAARETTALIGGGGGDGAHALGPAHDEQRSQLHGSELSGDGTEGEETVRFKVAWLLQAGADDAITLAARALELGATVVANVADPTAGAAGADGDVGARAGPLAEELAHGAAGGALFARADASLGAAASAAAGACGCATPRLDASAASRTGAHSSRFAVVLRSATAGAGGAPAAMVGALVVERPLPFGAAEIELFAELAQHLGASVDMHRARWQTAADLERAHAHAGRHSLLLAAARATLRTYANYDGAFEVAHAMAAPLGAHELNLYLLRKVDAHDVASVPFALGTPVLFSRMPAPEDRRALAPGGRRRLVDAYAPVCGILGHVASTGLAVSTADAQIHPLFHAQVDQLSARFGGKEASALLAVPVRDSLRHVVGVLQCSGRRQPARAPNAPHLPRAFADGDSNVSFSAEDGEFLEARAARAARGLVQHHRRRSPPRPRPALTRAPGATRARRAGVCAPARPAAAADQAACAGWRAGRVRAGGIDPAAGPRARRRRR